VTDGFSKAVLVHTSKAIIAWLKNNVRHYIPPEDWPTNSSDLSPVENISSIMAATVYASPQLQTLTALKRRLQKSWRSTALTTVQNLCLTD